MSDDAHNSKTYSLGVTSKLTGVSPELLRAWERRYQIVTPLRTPGGTRRYTAEQLETLRLVKLATDRGHRVGKVAKWSPDELREQTAPVAPTAGIDLDALLDTARRLDSAECQRLLSMHFGTLGPRRFAREVAIPLTHEIGELWAQERLGIASEHLVSSVLRSVLGAAIQPSVQSLRGPRIVLATPANERHELGILVAALTALGAGANTIHLGIDLPVRDLLGAVDTTRANVLALSIITLPPEEARAAVGELREGLSSEVEIWLGGRGAAAIASRPGIHHIESLEELEHRVSLLVATVG